MVSGASLVTARIMYPTNPGRLKVAADIRTQLIDRTVNRLTDLSLQSNTSRRLSISTNHGNPVRCDLHSHVRGHSATQEGICFRPMKGRAKIRAAGTATNAGVIIHQTVIHQGKTARFCDKNPSSGNTLEWPYDHLFCTAT